MEAATGAAETGKRFEGFGLIARALLVAAVLVVLKAAANQLDWEFISTLPLLTGLMGGVVFTLAILLAGVLSDFKESERLVGELASLLRRIHWDLQVISIGDDWLARNRGHLRAAVHGINNNFARGTHWRQREVYPHLDAMDRELAYAAGHGAPSSPLRTVQVHLGNVQRIIDRIEVIIETTFAKTGYYYAGAVVAVALIALMFTNIEPFRQGLLLYGFASFLLTGLFMLVYDLDNPFAGAVRLSTRQMQKLQAFLDAQQGASPGGGPAPAEPRAAPQGPTPV